MYLFMEIYFTLNIFKSLSKVISLTITYLFCGLLKIYIFIAKTLFVQSANNQVADDTKL